MEKGAESFDFAVDHYAQCLKYLCEFFFLFFRIYERIDSGKKRLDGFYRSLVARFYNRGGEATGVFEFSVEIKCVGKLLFTPVVDIPSCRARGVAVHAHVKWSFPAEGKAAFRVIEVVK